MICGERLDRLTQLHDLRARVDREIKRLETELRIELRRANRGARIRRRQGIEHGTNAGYQWHLRRAIPFPEDEGLQHCGCREAHAAYVAIATRRRRANRRLVGAA